MEQIAGGATMSEPSGLIPTGPPRPRFREAHPIRLPAVAAGFSAGGVWLALFAALGQDLSARVWWATAAALVAWLVAVLLARRGDRGAATGVATAVGLGLAAAAVVVVWRWAGTGNWPLW